MNAFEEDLPRNYQIEKREVLILVLIFTILTTFFTLLFRQTDIEQVINLAGAVGYGFFILWWCKIDGDERKFNLTNFYSAMLVVFGIFALVFYLLKTRGLKAGLTAIGYVALILMGIIIINTFVIAIYAAIFNVEL